MIKADITDIDIIERLDKLSTQYPAAYSRLESIHIYQYFYLGRTNDYIDNILQEALDQIDVLEESRNFYKIYTDLLESNYGLDHNIVEVGGGRFARLAKHMAKRQTSGNITMYDPNLLSTQTNQPNLLLLKDIFSHNTQLGNTETLVGLLPCEATDVMIDLACKNKINFQIALCDCLIPDFFLGTENEEEAFKRYVIDPIKDKVKDAGMGNLEVLYLKEYDFENPIIYTKFKK